MNTLGLLQVPNPGIRTRRRSTKRSKFLIAEEEGWPVPGALGRSSANSSISWRRRDGAARRWQPAVMAVKAQGKQCTYAVPKEGYRAWAIGVSPITGTPNKDAVIAYADYWLSGPPAITGGGKGITRRRPTSRSRCPGDKYAFWYDGKPWKRTSEGSTKAICATAALLTRASKVAYWHQSPDEYDYLMQKWDELLSA